MDRLKAVWPEVWKLMRPRRGLLAIGFVLMVCNKLAGFVLPYSSKFLIDNVVAKHQTGLLRPIVLAVLLATVIQGITSFSLTQLLSKAAQRLIAELRQQVQAHISRLPVSFYDANKTGALVSRIMSDVEGVRNLLGTGLVDFVGGIVAAAIALVLLLRISVPLTLMAVGSLACFAVVLNKAFTTIRPIFRERGKINAEVTGRLTESLGGVRVIKGYHAEQREERVFAGGVRRLLDNVMRTLTATSLDESFRQPADGDRGRGHHVHWRAPDAGAHAESGQLFLLQLSARVSCRAHHADCFDRDATHGGSGGAGANAGDHARAS